MVLIIDAVLAGNEEFYYDSPSFSDEAMWNNDACVPWYPNSGKWSKAD